MRMIERWFPCAEVSEASGSGWGSGQSEKALFTWFAARPLAQAKAAVITSLLPWPDDEAEQKRLKELVCGALASRDGKHAELLAELKENYPEGAKLLDPFSGRAMIPLESARLNVSTIGVDYSPVATIAGQLLADHPLRDWSAEPPIIFGASAPTMTGQKLVDDVQQILAEVGRRYAAEMSEFFPKQNGRQPWGYLWATTIPCQECKRRFPLTGSLILRHPVQAKGDPGQSYRIDVDRAAGSFQAVVQDGMPIVAPTMVSQTKNGKKLKGKIAVCPFCDHVHDTPVHTRLANEGLGIDALLIAADLDERVGKRFRAPSEGELAAAKAAVTALANEPVFAPGFGAAPNETIPLVNTNTLKAISYGARTFADLMTPRQTLAFVRLCRTISNLGIELHGEHGVSAEYATALAGYATSVLVRKLKYSTRGAALQPMRDPRPSRANTNPVKVNHIFVTEAALAFNYDFFEAALGNGPATWDALCDDTIKVLRNQLARAPGRAAEIRRGSALALPLRDKSVDAVVTDPPYDSMIPYSDASDLFFVWLKRALYSTNPELSITSNPDGVQEKTEEVIVTANRLDPGEHRTKQHYDRSLSRALAEARRVVRDEGVVTIVFGHGEPEVWHRLLAAITEAGLFLTGSWPAKTETGGGAGSANIVTTLTMSCRPVPANRKSGRAADVEAEIRHEIASRVPKWDAAGLAPTDQSMASAGPAMEIVGKYSEILDHLGEPVNPSQYLVIARRAVRESAAIVVDTLPLESFDSRTAFALYWVRLYARSIAPKSEARWEALAADLGADGLRSVLVDVDRGVRFCFAAERSIAITDMSGTIDVALAMALAWKDGLDAVSNVLLAAGRDGDDAQLWAALAFLSARLPEADPDAIAWTALVRNRRGIKSVARDIGASRERSRREASETARQGSLFDAQPDAAKEVV